MQRTYLGHGCPNTRKKRIMAMGLAKRAERGSREKSILKILGKNVSMIVCVLLLDSNGKTIRVCVRFWTCGGMPKYLLYCILMYCPKTMFPDQIKSDWIYCTELEYGLE